MRGGNQKNYALLWWAPLLPQPESLEIQPWKFASTQNANEPIANRKSEFIRCAVRIRQINKLIKLQFIDHAKLDTHQFEPVAFGNPQKFIAIIQQSIDVIYFHFIHFPYKWWSVNAQQRRAAGRRAIQTHKSINIAMEEAFIRSRLALREAPHHSFAHNSNLFVALKYDFWATRLWHRGTRTRMCMENPCN